MSEDLETTDLSTATFDELVQELKTRCENMFLYAERLEREEWMYHYSRVGDVVRLHGAMHLRVIPHLKREHHDSFKDVGDEEGIG